MTDEELLIWLRVEDTNLTDFAADRIEELTEQLAAARKEPTMSDIKPCHNKGKPRQADGCAWEWVVCAGRGSAFNVYRCATCGKEDWL